MNLGTFALFTVASTLSLSKPEDFIPLKPIDGYIE